MKKLLALFFLFAFLLIPKFGLAIPIDSCGSINQPGEYELTRNVQNPQFGNGFNPLICINIQSQDVSLDCRGFFISSLDEVVDQSAISINSPNVTVRNCVVENYLAYTPMQQRSAVMIYGNDQNAPLENIEIINTSILNSTRSLWIFNALNPRINNLKFAYTKEVNNVGEAAIHLLLNNVQNGNFYNLTFEGNAGILVLMTGNTQGTVLDFLNANVNQYSEVGILLKDRAILKNSIISVNQFIGQGTAVLSTTSALVQDSFLASTQASFYQESAANEKSTLENVDIRGSLVSKTGDIELFNSTFDLQNTLIDALNVFDPTNTITVIQPLQVNAVTSTGLPHLNAAILISNYSTQNAFTNNEGKVSFNVTTFKINVSGQMNYFNFSDLEVSATSADGFNQINERRILNTPVSQTQEFTLTLDPRREISSCQDIMFPGNYWLAQSFSTDGKPGACIYIYSNDVELNGRGFSITASSNNSLYGVLAANANNVTLLGLEIHNFTGVSDTGLAGAAVAAYDASNVSILVNLINGSAGNGVELTRCSNCIVETNTINNTKSNINAVNSIDQSAIFVQNSTGVMISSNTVPNVMNSVNNVNVLIFGVYANNSNGVIFRNFVQIDFFAYALLAKGNFTISNNYVGPDPERAFDEFNALDLSGNINLTLNEISGISDAANAVIESNNNSYLGKFRTVRSTLNSYKDNFEDDLILTTNSNASIINSKTQVPGVLFNSQALLLRTIEVNVSSNSAPLEGALVEIRSEFETLNGVTDANGIYFANVTVLNVTGVGVRAEVRNYSNVSISASRQDFDSNSTLVNISYSGVENEVVNLHLSPTPPAEQPPVPQGGGGGGGGGSGGSVGSSSSNSQTGSQSNSTVTITLPQTSVSNSSQGVRVTPLNTGGFNAPNENQRVVQLQEEPSVSSATGLFSLGGNALNFAFAVLVLLGIGFAVWHFKFKKKKQGL